MRPYYQDDWVTIYHGDSLETLPMLPLVDLIVTDPPYNIGKKYGKHTNDKQMHRY